MKNRFVGGWGWRRVLLRPTERVVKEGACFRKIRFWRWRLGKLFLTNQRLIWTSSWDFPVSPSTIELQDILDIGVPDESTVAKVGMPAKWYVRTPDMMHLFSRFSIYQPFRSDRDEWVQAIRAEMATDD